MSANNFGLFPRVWWPSDRDPRIVAPHRPSLRSQYFSKRGRLRSRLESGNQHVKNPKPTSVPLAILDSDGLAMDIRRATTDNLRHGEDAAFGGVRDPAPRLRKRHRERRDIDHRFVNLRRSGGGATVRRHGRVRSGPRLARDHALRRLRGSRQLRRHGLRARRAHPRLGSFGE